jgi:hypothetical protein
MYFFVLRNTTQIHTLMYTHSTCHVFRTFFFFQLLHHAYWYCRVVISTSLQWGAELTKLNVPADWKGTRLSQMLVGTLALKLYALMTILLLFFLCRMANLAHTLGALPCVGCSVLCIPTVLRLLLGRPNWTASTHQAMECSERGSSISWKPEPVVNLAATSVLLLQAV